MDKPGKNEASIRIKINGEEKEFEENLVVHDWKDTKKETAAGSEALEEDESFDWVLPDPGQDQGELKEFKQISYVPAISKKSWVQPKGPKRKGGLSNLVFSIATAVIIGLILGYAMLHLFTSKSEPAVSLGLEENHEAGAGGSDAKSGGEATALTLNSFNVPVIQAGIFTSEEAAKTTAAEIAAKGFPASVAKQGEQYYLYSGTAGTVEEAKVQAQKMKDQQIDVFAKTISAGDIKVDGVSGKEAAFLNDAAPLFLLLSETSGSLLSGNGAQLDADVPDKIKSMEQIGDFSNKEINELKKDLIQGYSGIETFKKSGNEKDLIDAQQALLDFLSTYLSLKD
ncbi:SPOR domain-containing protein [Falsibacillus pallidus]|uniref:Stage II sporulation protein B n=1 Tax=Falsibacillus pallidus TaxID=493781 RepID=A0A370GK49_9BACI|nr:SPOR domain-containing protein [Falsibacillus pallidus]RDI44152.1 stage II sporulation protein B [Falsibacillus pallidus]